MHHPHRVHIGLTGRITQLYLVVDVSGVGAVVCNVQDLVELSESNKSVHSGVLWFRSDPRPLTPSVDLVCVESIVKEDGPGDDFLEIWSCTLEFNNCEVGGVTLVAVPVLVENTFRNVGTDEFVMWDCLGRFAEELAVLVVDEEVFGTCAI